MKASQSTHSPMFPKWFLGLNMTIIVIGIALVLTYWGVGEFIRGLPPYDYLHLMSSSQQFCYSQSTFEFGWPHLYPATFYTTFCGFYHYAPPVLSFLWLMIPTLLVLWLSGRRAAVLVYPPFVILLILGQSTWLIIPIYALIVFVLEQNKPLKWWQGILLAGTVFKPHIAILGVIWLIYRGFKYRGFWMTAFVTWFLLTVPGIFMRPTWLFEWLPSGRGFEPISLGSIAIIPVRLLGLDVSRVIGMDPGPVNQLIVWFFCGALTVILLLLLRRRRGRLTIYDWLLVFCFANPLLNDYDLVILLPFVARYPRRLLLTLVCSLAVWVYVLMTGYSAGTLGQYNAVLLITTVLLFERFYKPTSMDTMGVEIKW